MMFTLKSYSERISRKLHRYTAASQTGFDARTTFGLMVIGSLVLWPFAIYHFVAGYFFININDTYGHIKGDEVLVEIAGLMGKRLRTTDSLYRYGGEEFLVLAGGTNTDGGRILAEDLHNTILNSRPCELSGISISLGVAQYTSPESISEWLHRADEALYRAKANGRNRVELASLGSG